MVEPLLSVRGLSVEYGGQKRLVAVDDVSFDVHPGEVLGLAGESGSGKSTLAHALLRTLPPPARIRRGEVWFDGTDLLGLSFEAMQRVRFEKIAIVFQSAMNALNPILRVGAQIVDVLQAHETTTTRAARARAEELFGWVGIPSEKLDAYPHQLSGGMRQRAVIAIALALRPKLLLMDEPTTALDVVVQKAILERLLELKSELGFAVVLITHDLELLFQFSDRLAVLYAGRLAEIGPSAALRTAPLHPYTAGLTASFPSVHGVQAELAGIRGAPPVLGRFPSGCAFHPRCDHAVPDCASRTPELRELARDRRAACHLPLVAGAPLES